MITFLLASIAVCCVAEETSVTTTTVASNPRRQRVKRDVYQEYEALPEEEKRKKREALVKEFEDDPQTRSAMVAYNESEKAANTTHLRHKRRIIRDNEDVPPIPYMSENPPYSEIGEHYKDDGSEHAYFPYYSEYFIRIVFCSNVSLTPVNPKRLGYGLFMTKDELMMAGKIIADYYKPSPKRFNLMRYVRLGVALQMSMSRYEAMRRYDVVDADGFWSTPDEPSALVPDDPFKRKQPAINELDFRPNFWADDWRVPHYSFCPHFMPQPYYL